MLGLPNTNNAFSIFPRVLRTVNKCYSAYIALTSEIEGYYSNPSSLASYSESNNSEPEENFHIDIQAEDHSPNDSDSEMDEDDIPISGMLMAEELKDLSIRC